MSEKRPASVTDWLGISNAPNWAVARPLGKFLAIVVALLFGLAVVAAFAVLGRLVFGGGEVSLGSGALVAALLGAPFVIWGTVLKHQTVMFQKEGHMTDRISKAVEQLGAEKSVKGREPIYKHRRDKKTGRVKRDENGRPIRIQKVGGGDLVQYRSFEESKPNIEVRIGAILSLERVAQDSTRHDKGRDHVRVMEILCAYIRENSNLSGSSIVESSDSFDFLDLHWSRVDLERSVDLRLALSVVGRRSKKQLLVEAGWSSEPTLSEEWPFSEPSIEEMNLPNFQGISKEYRSTLPAYRGFRLDLRGADLRYVDLESNKYSYSEMNFAGARFEHSKFDGAILSRVNLNGSIFFRNSMKNSKLSHISLRDSVFIGVDICGATVKNIDFRGAIISGLKLNEFTTLEDVNLNNACFRQVDLPSEIINTEMLNSVFGDATVKLSSKDATDCNSWPKHWPKWRLPSDGSKNDFQLQWRLWQSDPDNYKPPDPE